MSGAQGASSVNGYPMRFVSSPSALTTTASPTARSTLGGSVDISTKPAQIGLGPSAQSLKVPITLASPRLAPRLTQAGTSATATRDRLQATAAVDTVDKLAIAGIRRSGIETQMISEKPPQAVLSARSPAPATIAGPSGNVAQAKVISAGLQQTPLSARSSVPATIVRTSEIGAEVKVASMQTSPAGFSGQRKAKVLSTSVAAAGDTIVALQRAVVRARSSVAQSSEPKPSTSDVIQKLEPKSAQNGSLPVAEPKPATAKAMVCPGCGNEYKAGANSLYCRLCGTKRPDADADHCLQTFDYHKTTEENYCVPHFIGDYADVRPLLDHSYHKMYHATRIPVQDQLVTQFMGNTAGGHELLPWIIFTAGAMGAGKGYVREWMADQGFWPLDRFVIVDPDAIRQALPEWEEYVKVDAEHAGDMTQKEAGLIAEILGYAALRERLNVVFDGSLRNAGWYKCYFQNLRHNFPGVRIMILHIVADREDVLKRAEERGKKTGRFVPRQTLIESMEATPRSVSELAPYSDFVCRVLNIPGQEPQVVREPGAPHPPESIEINWDLIRTLWAELDVDGDGNLSKEELEDGLAKGIITEEVIKSIDADDDGHISKDEVFEAQKLARKAATMNWS